MDDKAEKVALFRYGLIAPLVLETLPRGELTRRAHELDTYLAQHLKAAGVSQPLFDETARQGMYQATKGIPRKVNKLAMTALRLAAASKSQTVSEAILLDAAAEAML